MPNPRISEWSNAGLISDCCFHFLYFAIDKGTTYQIMAYGVMSLPCLVINEKVVSYGKILSKADIEKFIDAN